MGEMLFLRAAIDFEPQLQRPMRSRKHDAWPILKGEFVSVRTVTSSSIKFPPQ